jgi:arsenate reductase
MAEAIVNKKMCASWQAFSAGMKPAGYVHPFALRVLSEIGIYHVGKSKSVNDFISEDFDLVVTVCDAAAEECPLWLGPGRTIHLGFPDPAAAVGSESQILDEFREVRDAILTQIPELLANYS